MTLRCGRPSDPGDADADGVVAMGERAPIGPRFEAPTRTALATT